MKLFDKLKNLTKAEIIMIIFLILGILVSVFVLEPVIQMLTCMPEALSISIKKVVISLH